MRKSLFRRLVALAILIVLSIVAIVIGVTVLSSTAGGIILTFMGGVGLASGLVMGVMMLAHERALKKNIAILNGNIEKLQTEIDDVNFEQENLEKFKSALLAELEIVYPGNNLRSPIKERPTATAAEQKLLTRESPSQKSSIIEKIFRFFNPLEDSLETLRKKEKRLDDELTQKSQMLTEQSLAAALANTHLEELDRPELKNVKNIMYWRDTLLRKGDEKIMLLEGERAVLETKPNLEDREAHHGKIASSSENQTESSANRSLGL